MSDNVKKFERTIPSFFIIGPGRSGNTLLRRLLVEQTNACIPDEIYVIGDVIRLSMRCMDWRDFVIQSIRLIRNQEDGDLLLTDFDALINYLLKVDISRQSVATLISAFYEHECMSLQQVNYVIGDKTPLNTFSAMDLMKIFPESKFIFMLRFPVDVVSSYVTSGIYSSYEQSIDRVHRSYKVFKKIKSRKSVLPVFYEELVKDTSHTLKSVVKHLNLEFIEPRKITQFPDAKRHEHHREIFKSISTKNIGKGLSTMPFEAINACQGLVMQYFKFRKNINAV